MWHNEREFGKYLMRQLKAQDFWCTRLESGMTVKGLPDLWVQGHGDDYYIELKYVNKGLSYLSLNRQIKVPWREGQQAWAAIYKEYHRNGKHGKVSFTFVGLNDSMIMIPMREISQDNVVYITEMNILYHDMIRGFDFNKYFKENSYY